MSILLETLDASIFEPPPEAVDFYVECLRLLAETDFPFLLSGTYALSCYTGISRPTKDLDIFCKPSDAPKILSFFKDRGYRIEIEDERWIGKVWKDDHFFDVIYNISSASIPITDDWFQQIYEVEVYGTIGGGVVGALLGNQVGKGSGKTVATIAGAVGGAFAGRAIEGNVKKTSHYEVLVRLQNGGTQTASFEVDPGYRIGDKVKITDGVLVRDL